MPHATPPLARPRFGWYCQYVPPDGDAATAKRMNPGTVTVLTLSRPRGARRVEKLDQVRRRKMQALHLQSDMVAQHPSYRRLLRMNSGLLPVYTHAIERLLYQEPGIRSLVEAGLGQDGSKAKAKNLAIDDRERSALRFGALSP